MLARTYDLPRNWPWPAVVLVAVGLVALAAGALGGEFAATVQFGGEL